MQYPELPEESHYRSLMDLCFSIHKVQIISSFFSHRCDKKRTKFQTLSYYIEAKTQEDIQISDFKAKFNSGH